MNARFLFILCGLLAFRPAAAQDLKPTISKVTPACVRMWGFDTLQQVRTSAQFSGVVVKGNYILTAAHVTVPGNTYKVFFPDGRETIGEALGKIELADDKTRPDVGIIKIVKKGEWPSVALGSSAALVKDELCLSVAYPESLNLTLPTVRLGKIINPLNDRGFIHSTALMEPGDSGGPLFNLAGELIGLHSAIEISEADNYDVPVDLYQKYWTALQQPIVYHNWPDNPDHVQPVPVKKMTFKKKSTNNYSRTCIQINSRLNGRGLMVLGTVIKSIIVSKSSMVGDSIMILGKAATIIARDKANDLVLIRLAQKLKGLDIKFAAELQTGDILSAPVLDKEVNGIVSGSALDLPKIASAGFLGATPVHGSSPAKIYFVRPGSPAAKQDIRVGDIIPGITDTLANHWPGDTLKFTLLRGQEHITKNIVLTYPPQMIHDHPAEHFAGGKSQRRDGFNAVYTTDLILSPEQCGGPAFDENHRFVGINIARFSRANSILVSAKTVLNFINAHL